MWTTGTWYSFQLTLQAGVFAAREAAVEGFSVNHEHASVHPLRHRVDHMPGAAVMEQWASPPAGHSSVLAAGRGETVGGPARQG